MKERHRLFSRDEEGKDFVSETFKTYREAIEAGQSRFGYARFWVSSQQFTQNKWIEFAPEPVNLPIA